jgi:hypothetical protein
MRQAVESVADDDLNRCPACGAKVTAAISIQPGTAGYSETDTRFDGLEVATCSNTACSTPLFRRTAAASWRQSP